MKDLLGWWFFPKRAKRFSSIIKIIIGLLVVYSFFSTLIGNMVDFIAAYVNPPLYLGMSYLLLPITFTLFIEAVFGGGLFCLPYYIFGKRSKGRKRYLIPVLLASMIVGSSYAGVVYTKPGTVEIARTQLALLEDRLGEINRMGEFYTLREFGYDIARLSEPVPDFFISEAEGFSKLVLFYKDCEKSWEEYGVLPNDMESDFAFVSKELYGSDGSDWYGHGYGYGYETAKSLWSQYDELPNKPTSVRTKYRLNHPEVEASLIFWGELNKTVFTRNSAGGKEVISLLDTWAQMYGITKSMQPNADWSNALVPVYK